METREEYNVNDERKVPELVADFIMLPTRLLQKYKGDSEAKVWGWINYRCQRFQFCTDSLRYIAGQISSDVATVSRAMARLIEDGYIEAQDNGSRKKYRTTTGVQVNLQFVDPQEVLHQTTRVASNNTLSEECCIKQQEEKKTKEDRRQPAQNAGSSSSKTEETETSFMRIDLVDDQDVEHPCARCEEMINVSSLEKSNAKCPYCGYGVWVYDWNGKSLKKPPQGARKPKRKGKTLRDFFPEINESLARYVLSAYQEKRLRALIKIGHQSLFLSSLEWAQQKIKETHMPPDRWIDNALTAAEGKSENQTVTEDAIKRDVTAYVEPSASVKLHVLNLSREYELPEIEMAIWWASTLTEYYDENNMNWDSMSETQKKYGVQRIIDNKWHGYWNISEYVEGWKRNG